MDSNMNMGPDVNGGSKSKGIIWAIVAIIIIGLIVYFVTRKPAPQGVVGEQNQSSSSEEASSMSSMAQKVIKLRLNQQNKSGESGTATLTELGGGKVKVALQLSGAPKDAAQPSHIHMGSCAKLGEVKFALNDVLNGASETTISTSFDQIFKSLPLAINVHKSAKESGKYVACGDFTIGNLIEGYDYILEAKG